MGDSVSADALHLLRLILDTPDMRELSVAEQRYQAVLAVISDGLSISRVAEKVGVSRQTLHSWLARYEARGLEGLVDRCALQLHATICNRRARTVPGATYACPAGPRAAAGTTVHEPGGAARRTEASGWPGGPVPAWATRTSVPSPS